jgi:CopG family nickel-responsive transcriptional regulator
MAERLRDELDTFAEEHGYSGRSEVIREACQKLLSKYKKTDYEGKQVLATVTAVFGYDEPEIERQMMDVRHEYDSLIRSNSHNCLEDNAGCVETFVIESVYEDALQSFRVVRNLYWKA